MCGAFYEFKHKQFSSSDLHYCRLLFCLRNYRKIIVVVVVVLVLFIPDDGDDNELVYSFVSYSSIRGPTKLIFVCFLSFCCTFYTRVNYYAGTVSRDSHRLRFLREI